MTERDELHMLKNMKAPIAALLLFTTSLFARGGRFKDFRTATPAELAMQSVPFAPGAPAVVLNWIQRRDDEAMYESEYLRIKVLAPEGKKYGDVEIPYISQWTGAVAFEARLTRPDGTIIPFTGKTYDKLAVKFGGIRVMVKTFSIPDVQPGSIIEYSSEVGLRYTPMHYTFTLQRDLPVLSAMLWIHPDNDPWLIDYRRLPEDVKKTKTRDSFQLDIQNIPPFEAEPYSLPERELKAVAHFFYTDRDLKIETFWLDKGKKWTPIIEDFISGDVAPIHEAAQQAIALAATPEEKLRKLYAVAQRIRNLDYESDKTEAEEKRLRENHSAQDVLRNGYGHSIEINRLFIALARSAGFEAHAVCIGSRRDGFFAKTLPSASQLDDEVALVKLDGKEIAVDAGTPTAPFATLAWQKAPVPGLKLQKKHDPEWIETPGLDATCARVVHKVALRVAGDAIKGKATVTYQGQDALIRRLEHYADDDAATKKSFEESVKSLFPEGTTVTLSNLSGLRTADPAIVAEFDLDLPNSASFVGSRIMLPMSVFRATVRNPFAATQRKSGVYYHFPFTEDDAVTLEVPPGYSIETMPATTEVLGGAIVYRNHYDTGENSIHFTRHLEVNAVYIPVDKYPALRSIYSKIASADQEQIILRKTAKVSK